jgi:hypothetical protein
MSVPHVAPPGKGQRRQSCVPRAGSAALKRQHGWDRARIRGLAGARVWCGWGVLCHNAIKIAAHAC